MKNVKTLSILIGLLLISFSSYSKDYYNSNYKINKSSYSLSFIPIYNDGCSLMNDTLSTKIFSKKTDYISLFNIAEIRQKIDSDNEMIKIFTKIAEVKYKGKELKALPNLNTIITQSEIEYLKDNLNNSDLILIPLMFSVKNLGSYTFGKSKFRLYDLNTGEFILECTKDVNVNMGGTNGKGGITAALLSLSFEYFDKKFISNMNSL